ncbi:MAG: stage II sporulation protein R [Clostridia bacterium]|nr:stage II sporulation protein R [Clostridia bacterium]
MNDKRNRWFFCVGATLILTGVFACLRVQALQSGVREEVLRLHIVANSDTPCDQAVKIKVRNRILQDCGMLFADCASQEEAASIARERSGLICRVAEKALRENGVFYPVSVRVEECRFPTKSYGGVRLPAGRYTAVNLRIGAGMGQNWWCVMYPPLCLTGDAVKADEQTLAQLRKELSAEEYALVTETSSIQVKVKFRIAEWLGKRFINLF